MASCMYRVGDYVYFEGNPSEPFLIRRIEELNKTPNGNVEARVACFCRRRDISSYLVNQVDRLKIDGPWEDDDEVSTDTNGSATNPSGSNASSQSFDLNETQKHQLRHRELFLTRQNETLLATNIRGKCSVTLYNETESFLSYLNTEDLFFYQLVYDPNQKTLNADRGEIRVGGKYQADVPTQPFYTNGMEEENPQSRENLIWDANGGLTEKQIEQFLIIARSIGTFARALDCPTALKHPSLHMSAASASRDATLFFAMDTLHKHHYDLALAACNLVPNTGPILVKDQMEDWSAAEANSFEDAIEKCGKDFIEIQKEYLPWKSLKGIIEYYYMWKTTDRYVVQRRLKLAEQENKLKQVFIPNYNKAHQCLLPNRPQSESKPCESCGTTSSAQWYQWNTTQLHTRLCAECWIYYKKLGGLKYPKKSGPDRRQERAANINKLISYKCTVTGCGKECKNKSALQRHYILGHGIMVRSGSPRPLSKPRNTFALYSTPLSRAVRTLCPIRRLARRSLYGIDLCDIRNQWEKHINEKPTEDIRFTCLKLQNLYKQGNKRYKPNHLNNLFPCENENKTLEDCIKFEEKISNENEINLPIRYPKLQEDSSEFYTQFTHNYTSILKKRPYESNENSNDGPSPKRTLISRQNLIKTKSPSTAKLSRSRAYTVPFVDPPDGIYLRVTKDIKRLRKEIPPKDIRRIARAPWKKLNTNFVSYVDDDIVVLD
jgi:metastasis-associated protein MTA